jgi:hypothetical protein
VSLSFECMGLVSCRLNSKLVGPRAGHGEEWCIISPLHSSYLIITLFFFFLKCTFTFRGSWLSILLQCHLYLSMSLYLYDSDIQTQHKNIYFVCIFIFQIFIIFSTLIS